MTKFKDLLNEKSHFKKLTTSSVSITLKTVTLYLRLDSKDVIQEASYEGKYSPWYSSLCDFIPGMPLLDATLLTKNHWEKVWAHDQVFWDLWQEKEEAIFFEPLEALRAALDVFRGRDHLYTEQSALLCRCFGVRERDVSEFLITEKEPTLEKLTAFSKAGMGCRSCIPQLKRMLDVNKPHTDRHYKEKSRADWLLEIDYMLSCFPEAEDWKMEVQSFKEKQVIISFNKKVSQKEEEEVGLRLQDFLGAALDLDLGFFLRRARQ